MVLLRVGFFVWENLSELQPSFESVFAADQGSALRLRSEQSSVGRCELLSLLVISVVALWTERGHTHVTDLSYRDTVKATIHKPQRECKKTKQKNETNIWNMFSTVSFSKSWFIAARASVDQQVAACSHNSWALMSKCKPEVSAAAWLRNAAWEWTLLLRIQC